MSFVFEMQPAEIRRIGVDFVNELADGDSIASVTVTCDGDILSGTASVDGTTVSQLIGLEAGIAEGTYNVSFKAITANGERSEEDVFVVVAEVGTAL